MGDAEAESQITTAQIDAVLPYLERFESEGFEAGSWWGGDVPGQMRYFRFSDVVSEFHQTLYEAGWVNPAFDWTKWQDSAERYIDSPELIESADVETIQKLFTTHARADRFSEGHLAAMFANGQIVALLRRLKTIRGTLP